MLRICRDYGQGPGWYEALDRGTQALLLGDLRLRDADYRREMKAAQRSRK